jgi:hypothetical protein
MRKAIPVPARVIFPTDLVSLIDARVRALELSRGQYLIRLARQDIATPLDASPVNQFCKSFRR